ncbi:MAG: LrgB family protein, partial [Pseudomonadota bacterium]
MGELRDVWVYLSATPLLHLTLTLAAFQFGSWVYSRGKMNPTLNPVLLAVVLIVAVLLVTGTRYDAYFEGAQFVHFLLGPATVALAIPLYRQFERVRRSALAVLVSILAGSTTAMLSAVGIGYVLSGSSDTLIALAPKSVTAPVAMGIAEQLGGLPSLTAVLVLITGITGAVLGPYVLTLIGVKDWAARGLAMGTASHGIGTARALQVSEIAGAF